MAIYLIVITASVKDFTAPDMFNRTRENRQKVCNFKLNYENNNDEAWYLIVHGIANSKVDGGASKGDETFLLIGVY
jgi:hypothetical protein